MGFTPAISESGTVPDDTLERSATKNMRNASLRPNVSTSFKDSHFFSDVEIVSCEFAPFLYLDGRSNQGAQQQ